MTPTPRPLPAEERKALADVRARYQLDLLLHVSRVLALQDELDAAKGLPALIVPAIGDWCAVDLVEGDGLRRVASHHVDPGLEEQEAILREQHPGWVAGPAEVARSLTATLVFDIRSHPEPDNPHAVLAALGLVSVAMVPIRTPDRVLGVLTIATGADRRGPRPSDVAAFEELASRVAYAIERAELREVVLAASQQTAELEAAHRLAHDFGNLLTRIVGYAELAERRLLTGDLPTAELAEIKAAGEAAVRLTRAHAAGDQRWGGHRAGLSDAGEVAAELEPELRALAGPSQLRIVALGPAPVPLDSSDMAHILRNLVANAGDATDERTGAGTVEVSTGPADGQPDRTELRVVDDGVGMDEPHLAACRTDGFTTRAGRGGSGRGLTMVQGLVDDAGGELHIESGPGAGTTVTVLLPHPA